MPNDQSSPDPRGALGPIRTAGPRNSSACSWSNASIILFARPARGKRLLLAVAYALRPDDRDDVIREMFYDCIPDLPQPPFMDPLADARFWATCTTLCHLTVALAKLFKRSGVEAGGSGWRWQGHPSVWAPQEAARAARGPAKARATKATLNSAIGARRLKPGPQASSGADGRCRRSTLTVTA